MYDRRVVRGNTYAAQVVTQSAQRESLRLRQEHERRMRLEALRRRQVKPMYRWFPPTTKKKSFRAPSSLQQDTLLPMYTLEEVLLH